MTSRVAYTAAAAREAEARGWAWAYWQFDSDFIAYDIKKDAWIEPIHGALVRSKPLLVCHPGKRVALVRPR